MKNFAYATLITLALILVIDDAEAAKKSKPPLEEITLSGTISRKEMKKDKKTVIKYILTDEKGTEIKLPKPKKKGKGATPVNLEDYVDQKVTLVAKGARTTKKGKENITLKKIVKIEKMQAKEKQQELKPEPEFPEPEEEPEEELEEKTVEEASPEETDHEKSFGEEMTDNENYDDETLY